MAGLSRIQTGEVTVNGIDVRRDTRRAQRCIGLAPQELGIYPTVTVRTNLRFFGELVGLTGARLRDRIENVSELLDLVPLLDRPARELSGGEARRLHTAGALVGGAPLVILDEPTVGADVGSRQALLSTVRDLADSGSAVCYTTHFLHEVEAMGADVAFFQGGTVVAEGNVNELVTRMGRAGVELRFAGVHALALNGGRQWHEGEETVVRQLAEPKEPGGQTAARLVSALTAADAARLTSISMLAPTLEAVYHELTSGPGPAVTSGAGPEVTGTAGPEVASGPRPEITSPAGPEVASGPRPEITSPAGRTGTPPVVPGQPARRWPAGAAATGPAARPIRPRVVATRPPPLRRPDRAGLSPW